MRCLFCKENSYGTKSIEHIVPESLGNKSFVLPIGYVCDKCNNYFARKVEKPFLELPEIKLLRFQAAIPNKKDRMPAIEGLFNGKYPVELKRKISRDGVVTFVELTEEVFDILLNENNKNMNIIMPAFTNNIILKNNIVISRFLAKLALEALAEKLRNIDNSLEELIDNPQYDAIRYHARLGKEKIWPCSIRRIYDYDKIWEYCDGQGVQKIHESDFLLIEAEGGRENNLEEIYAEIYFVVALWGMEFVINMAGPEIEGYEKWLEKHDNVSPLYFGKNDR